MHIATEPNLQNTRFWVRPYEFEGSGSSGVADEIVTLQIGEQSRTFWLKVLEERLFFRELGRTEAWTFATTSNAHTDNLATFLEQEIEAGRYGRVILRLPPEACFLLARPNDVLAVVPKRGVVASRFWNPQKSARFRPFLDWSAGIFQMLSHGGITFGGLLWKQWQLPTVRQKWVRGSRTEFERLINALLHWFWDTMLPASRRNGPVEWRVQSAWAFGPMNLDVFDDVVGIPFSWSVRQRLPIAARRLVRAMLARHLFVGQGVDYYHDYAPRTLRYRLAAPTVHERVEAGQILEEWIQRKLPLQNGQSKILKKQEEKV